MFKKSYARINFSFDLEICIFSNLSVFDLLSGCCILYAVPEK